MIDIIYERHLMENPALPFIFHNISIADHKSGITNWHDNTEFLHCVEGQGFVNYDTTNIEIKKGDSLWSIANEYCEDGYYDNTKDYVEELKEINNLKTEKIHYGQRLVVAYYDCEFK
jgi:hypothetical protein